ncbi:MAG: gluconate:H+ symporter [Lautropia sp.]|nr:gluconate:H+ symporter [Lautropia sp.]
MKESYFLGGLPMPIVGLLIAVFVLIYLVLRTRVHAFLAMLIAASIAGMCGGMSATDTLTTLTKGFGSTLGSIGIVIGLGVMMGRVLEVSGAAEKMAYSFIRFLGQKREEWALAVTGYVVSIPIFVDSAFVVLYPVAKALARTGKRSLLTLGVALAGGLVVTHHVVPPTPGPLGVAGIFGVDLGAMLLLGMALAVPCVSSMVLYARWLDRKFPGFNEQSFSQDELRDKLDTYLQDRETRAMPSLFLSMLPIVLPISLIFLKAVVDLASKYSLDSAEALEAFQAGGAYQVVAFIGHPIVALAISVLVAVYTLMPQATAQETAKELEAGVTTAGIILLVTGAGGALGAILRESGAGAQLATQIAALPISPILIPFIVATLVRFIQGSGTVAMVTAASITAPVLAEIDGVNMLLAAQAATMGSLFFGYFNDSLFWVVNRMMGISDVKTQMIVWSIPTTIAWAVGGASIAVLNLVWGTHGSLADPLIPLVVLALLMGYVVSQNRKLATS